MDNYKVVSGGTYQITPPGSAGADFSQIRKGGKHKTDTKKYYQVNESGQSQCSNCRQDWDTWKILAKDCPILTNKYHV